MKKYKKETKIMTWNALIHTFIRKILLAKPEEMLAISCIAFFPVFLFYVQKKVFPCGLIRFRFNASTF